MQFDSAVVYMLFELLELIRGPVKYSKREFIMLLSLQR